MIGYPANRSIAKARKLVTSFGGVALDEGLKGVMNYFFFHTILSKLTLLITYLSFKLCIKLTIIDVHAQK